MLKVELSEAEADRSLHPHHTELWVRVLSDDPMSVGDWKVVKDRGEITPEVLDRFMSDPCAFHVDLWDDDDPEHELFGFEQWWIFPSRPGV